MKNMKAEFLAELEQTIKERERLQQAYKWMNVSLGVLIAGSGFLTAAASQTELKTTWVSSPTSLLIFGLLSAVCAILNQILSPSERHAHHKNVRIALQHIRGEVKYKNMSVKNAQVLRTLAIKEPEIVLGKLREA